jgi:hypothetical protein
VKLLTPDAFEHFINLFEKLTGMQDNYATLVSLPVGPVLL